MPYLHLDFAGDDIAIDLVEGMNPPTAWGMPYDYVTVSPAADSRLFLYNASWTGGYAYADVQDGGVVADPRILPDVDEGISARAAARDVAHSIDYAFNSATGMLHTLADGAFTSSQRIENAANVASAPVTVSDSSDVFLQIQDPESGEHGIQRYAFGGVAPAVVQQPVSQTVDLGSNDSAEVAFSATHEGGTGDVVQQWQVKAPGSSVFEDIEGETGTELTVNASRADDGSEFRSVFTNDAGRIASDAATLSVEYAPVVVNAPASANVVEGTDAVFETTFEGNPAPEVTWQRYDRGLWLDIASDDNFTVNASEGMASLTVTGTNPDQSGMRLRAKATNTSGASYTREAVLTVRPAVEIPEDGLTVEGVVVEWGLNEETQIRPPFGSSNYLSAGVSDGDEESYSAESGNVQVRQVGDGEFRVPTWDTRAAHVSDADVEQIVRLKGGTARLEQDGSTEVEFTGSFSVNFYDGLVPFTVTDPVLTVSSAGMGTLTGDLSGYGSDMVNPEERHTLDPVDDVTLVTFSGVKVDPEGVVVVEPDYSGVQVELPESITPQNRTVDGWGAWPQAFVDFQVDTGLSSYWYSSGSAADAHKAPASFVVDFAADEAGVPEPTEEPTEEPTTEPTTEPTVEPTEEPTAEPTEEPTTDPTTDPTEEPTMEPTEEPTVDPTDEPTVEPTEDPTTEPTDEPTEEPTEEPTNEPTAEPTDEPTEEPGDETSAPDASDLTEENRGDVRVPAEAVEGSTITVEAGTDQSGAELDPVLFSEPFSFDRVTVGADGTFEIVLPERRTGEHRLAVYEAGEYGPDAVIGWDEITITAEEPDVRDTPDDEDDDSSDGDDGTGDEDGDGSGSNDGDDARNGRGGDLPRTGTEIMAASTLGALLVLSGAAALVAARRRRGALTQTD
jgi:LPXTG-motif cell wall-anchored protein